MKYFAKEGFVWVFGGLFFTIMSIMYSSDPDGVLGLNFLFLTLPAASLTLYIILFFRDPNRTPAHGYHPQKSILSPADGSLCAVEEEDGDLALYIEMHLTNVHVTRSHLAGTVKNGDISIDF